MTETTSLTRKTRTDRLASLQLAYDGSYYTILGVGDVDEYVQGYTKELAEAGIGTPRHWFVASGRDINDFAAAKHGGLDYRDAFKEDLVVLLFPLDGLDGTKLPIFKVAWQDRWFDDVIQNMRRLS